MWSQLKVSNYFSTKFFNAKFLEKLANPSPNTHTFIWPTSPTLHTYVLVSKPPWPYFSKKENIAVLCTGLQLHTTYLIRSSKKQPKKHFSIQKITYVKKSPHHDFSLYVRTYAFIWSPIRPLYADKSFGLTPSPSMRHNKWMPHWVGQTVNQHTWQHIISYIRSSVKK